MDAKTWDIKLLKNKLEQYKRMLKRAKDEDDQEKLQETIESYEYFIEDLNSVYDTPSLTYVAKQDRFFFNRFPRIMKTILEANDIINFSDIDLREGKIPITIPNNKILTITRDFYEDIGGIFWEKFRDYYDSGNIYINFKKPNNKYNGGTILKPKGVPEAFVTINTFRGLYDVATSVHEHGHAIGAAINEDHMANLLVNEIESIFFELLYLDSLDQREYSYEDIQLTKEDALLLYHECFANIDAKFLTTKRGISNKKAATKIVKEKYEIEESDAENWLLDNMGDLVGYSLSFLVAVELFLIYKKNHYSALSILKKLIESNPKNDVDILNCLASYKISPGKNLEPFYKQYLNVKGISKKLH